VFRDKKEVRDVLAANLELQLILDPGRRTPRGRKEQRICLSEGNRREPMAQLLSVRVQRSEVLSI
jgi:hypothetical protein